jgi:hypothetical protein
MEQSPELRSKRNYISKREAFKIIQKQRSSKLSIAKFCELNHLAPSTFKRWVKRQGKDSLENLELPKPITRIIKPRKINLSPEYNNEEFIPLVLAPSQENINPEEPCLFAEVNGIKIYQRVDAAFLKSLLS